MADISPDDLPFVPDASVALIDASKDPATGLPKGTPTTAFHDWLSQLWSKMKGSLVDLTTKVTTLTADIDGLHGEIVEEATIRQTDDGILASQITTVSTVANNAQATATSAIGLATSAQNTANGATASGQVYLVSRAAPSGATAAYGWYLTAGNAYTGMEALALSSGGSAIGFTANQFQFTDNGTATAILTYSSGKWSFTSDVEIDGNLNIKNGTVTVNNIALGAVGFNGAHAYGTMVDLWPSSSTAWVDYTAVTLNPAKMGCGNFFFTFVGTAGSATTDGNVTMEFQIVRRKSGVDTVMYGPIQYAGGPTPVVTEYFRWFTDQAGAGTVQYVCQFRFANQGGASGGPGTNPKRQANYFRIDWQGFDT